jgi:magnesium transporter
VLVKTDAKISALVERLKALPRKKLPAVCFVTGKDNELKGLIRSGEIAFYDAESVCGSVMSSPSPSVRPTTSAQEALALTEREQLPLLPVTDEHNKVLGVVAQDVLLRAGREKTLWQRLTQ